MAKNSDLSFKTANEHSQALKARQYSAGDIVRSCLQRAEEVKDLGIYLSLDRKSVMEQASASDLRRSKGKLLSPIDGIPVSIKDNICVENEKTTCASRILENFIAPYDAAVVEKLKSAGAVLFGRTNMDEFAMGSSTENSAYQLTRNPWNRDYVPGGSSGGSAAAVASGCVPLALGSDTGGSIRQPASLCGIVGVKPTYGRVSRFGLVAFASSLDQIGALAANVEDAALLLSIINGHDKKDSTSHPDSDKNSLNSTVAELTPEQWKKIRIGVDVPEKNSEGFDTAVVEAGIRAVEFFRSKGAQIVPVHSKYLEYSLPIYYILATAEASSNLSRYDGIRYGKRAAHANDLMELYVRSRTEGFGAEVKRRILLGTFVLSSGYYDAYYKSAQKARKLIQIEYAEYFKKIDVLLQLTSPTTAFKIGEKSSNPLAMYRSDLLTITANLGGVPSMSLPAGLDEKGLPIGLQLTASHFDENRMFQIASALSKAPSFELDLKNRKLKGASGDLVKRKGTVRHSGPAKSEAKLQPRVKTASKPKGASRKVKILSSTKKQSGTKKTQPKKKYKKG